MATPILPYGSQSPYRIQNELPSNPQGKPPKKRRWGLTVFLIFLSALVVGVAGGAYYVTSLARSVVTEGGDHSAVLGIDVTKPDSIDPSKFTALGDGRFTMLLIGVDKAAGLTDTLQVLSIDLLNQEASLISIPRDLYVPVPANGSVKINEVYNIGEKQKDGGGPALLKQVVGTILDTKITNYAMVTFDGLKDLVNALGGITVEVPTALNDPLFPAEVGDGYAPFSVKAGKQTMNGVTALKYARSRQTTSDFDRSMRQQLVIDAIRTKALSAGILANPVTVSSLLDTVGKNFRTDLPLDAVMRIADIYNKIPSHKKQTQVLDTSAELDLLTSGRNDRGQYVIYPSLGQTNFTALQRWYRSLNPDPLLTREKATVVVQRTSKATQKQLDTYVSQLQTLGFSVNASSSIASSADATKLKTGNSLLLRKNDSSRITKNYLEDLLGVTSTKGDTENADFLIIFSGNATTTSGSVPSKSPSPSATTKP